MDFKSSSLKHKLIILILLIYPFYVANSQTNHFARQNTQLEKAVLNKLIGGLTSEYAAFGDGQSVCISPTSDGGYIVAGSTQSYVIGNFTAIKKGGFDFLVVKIASDGAIQWIKLIGGDKDDFAYSIIQTKDGGYVLGGSSNSTNSGDISVTNHGFLDYSVIRLDASGTILWSKLYGGSNNDDLRNLKETSDGGFVLCGFSGSPKSGDITDTNHGIYDIWVVKLKADGVMEWNKLIGGSQSDGAFSVQQTADGGYILCGLSDSNKTGDFTSTNNGYYDFAIIKIDIAGTLTWHKLYGTAKYEDAYDIQQTVDGGYIVAGVTQSATAPTNISSVELDGWIMKIDATGNKTWEKILSGAKNDIFSGIAQTSDGGFIFSGYSDSKDGDIPTTNHGKFDFWAVKTDAAGSIIWNKNYGGTGDDMAFSIAKNSSGSFVLAGVSTSSTNGDITDTNNGFADLWLLNIDNNGNITTISQPSETPIAHYPFNGNANDESGNGNNGVAFNATLTTDRFGKANSAYLFNGKDSRIDVNKAFFDVGWNDYTISCWINSSSVDNSNNYNNAQAILNTDPHNGIALNTYGSSNPFKPELNNKYSFLAGSDPSVRNWDVLPLDCISKSNRTVNTWNHLVVVKKGTSYSFYLNGVFDKTFVGLKTVPSNLTKIVFGNLASNIPDEGFLGKLDDFTIWNRGLSQTEITNLYNSTSAIPKTDLSLTSKSLKQTVKKDSTGQVSFTLKNQSSNSATNIKVLLKIPYSPPFVMKNSQNCTKGTFDSNMWTVPELAAGDSCVLNVIYQPTQSGVWYVEAEVFSADQEDTDSTPKNGIDTEDDFTRSCLTMPISVTTEPFGMQLMLEDPKLTTVQWYKDGQAIQGQTKNVLQITALGKYGYSSNGYKCPDQGCCPFIIEKVSTSPNCCSLLEYILERKN